MLNKDLHHCMARVFTIVLGLVSLAIIEKGIISKQIPATNIQRARNTQILKPLPPLLVKTDKL